ncbi:MAG: EAL domain-containing protein [Hassallia sp. WJT32-NPBG1]|jgi:diguanylate cyclase (GGDEF)-like protein/PAS domain S-box-containing protein|nr:EAL domain-containing protein [Hassallia sp. WJT32-NPBG1]
MLTISAYHLVAQLYESANSLVYRGRRVDTEQPVVLKMLKSYPTPERTAWFKREYEVTRKLTIPGVVDAYALFRDAEAVVMVLEDFGGDSLDLLGIAGQLELCEFLKLAIAITDILGQIHTANIIHKDINPSNIVLNPTTGQVKIIDFGISTVLSRENPTDRNPNILEGTLAYISPEQTGRMNRAIDYRSDFYSLGATFYELLTGILPFNSCDALELVHSHIAKQPVPPHEVVGTRDIVSLPSIVSDIVMKLMAKNAEDRYQSAYGLKADLEICLHQLQTNGQIDVFALGEQDISERFTIGQKLYGREPEIETLLEAFTRVAGGETENSSISTQSQIEMILVTGYSGVGKSTLVREVHKPITARRGNFIWGKFDQYQRNIPYYALSQAFDDLCKQLLTETEAVLNQWREKILAAVGNNGQVLIDVIPNLERVIDTQPPVVQVEASIAQNRFNLVFQNFIKVICQKSHPLVLFIDDLQWADKASLKLLKTIMSDATIQYLLIIGAYRDNEVNPSHPLMMTLEEIKKKQGVLSSIHLDNLLVQDVNALIAEALKSQPTSTQPLTDLVYEKTQGNAFFTTEFLKSLYTEGLLTFEYPPQSPTPLTKGGQRGVGGWQWDVAQIQAKDITDNVVELMAAKIGKLPTSTQMVLQLAACIGNKFDLSTLAIIYQHQPAKALADLLSAMQEGLIVPLNNKYKLIKTEDDFAVNEVSFKFLHDRVQQAAYALSDDTQKTRFHLQIARFLLHHTSPEALSNKLFEIVDHLNLGSEFVSYQAERDEIARLNLMASEKAKSAMAYEAAVKYLNVGLNLLAEDSWQTQYDLTLTLYESAAYAEYLNTNYERSELLSNVVLQQVKAVREKANVYETKIQLYIAQNQMQASIDIGLQFLEMLGISLSKSPPSQLVIDDLYNLPPMTDPDKLVAMRILKTIWSPVHTTNSSLAPFIVFTMMELCVNYGNSSFAAFAYVLYGFLLCRTQSNLDFGYQLGKLSLKMLKQFDSSEIEGKVNLLFNCFLRPWKEHKRNTLESLQETLKVLMETGDIEYASYAAINYCSNLVLVGEPLESVNKTYKNYISLVQSIKQDFSLYYAKIWGQLVLNLMGDSRESNRLVGELFDETEMLPILQINNNLQSLFVIDLAKTRLSYLFNNYTAAVKSAENAAGNKQSLSGLLAYAEHNLYYSLSLLANYLNQEDRERKQYIEQVAANQKEMKTWAVHAPMNFQHTYDLVEAEKARVLGQVVEAMDLYERAIKGARDNGYIQHEALAYELAANFYLARGMEEFAQLYMTKAHYGYVRWGAKAKVKNLEQQYPQFFAKTPSTSTKTITTILSTDSKASSELDLNSILKASQTLSSEIVLNTLLEKMMKIVLENAGAQKGYLILNQEGQWLIQASGAVTSDDIEVLQSIPIETVSDRNNIPIVSLGIVNYVTRTQESLILNDALHSGNFTRDPYIVKHQTKSVLCIPLLNQSKLAGPLYLENNQTTGAFTPDRLEVLKLLTSQIFISIENAKLYTNLQAYSTELIVKNTQLLKANRQLQAEIGDRKLAVEALRLSEERFRLAIDNIPDTFVIYDAKRRFQFVNAFGVNRGGFPLEAYIGRTDDEIHPKEVTNAYLPLLQKTVETRTKQTGECNISLPGCSFTIVVTYVPILNEHGEIHQILGITHDITERKRAEEQLLHNAFHDALTGLPNRAWFMECLKDAIERAKHQENYLFAVLFLDLDRFKVINDSLGHLLGDQFLIKIASRLKACLRSIDTAARLGGDEFTILLEGIENLSEAIEVVELIQQQLALPFDLDGQEVFTTASIGIALNSILTYDQPENLLRDADTAMYRAKVLGRARYELFNPDMYTNAVDRLQLETDLRRAIERREFRVYYQPIVSLSSGTISGFEALLRWQHPERGLVYPADFIPLAEETGLIVEIGYWVLFEACRQMQVWQMRYPTSFLDKISVNLCAKQFYQADLIEQIAQILHSTGLDACSLVLEITESAIMENGDEANTALSQLREMGIELSIDDFGTGYSSLGRLHTFPINVLKIDRSFVSPMDANNRNLEIIEIIVTLADKLGMDVTGEGVETQEQLALVRKLNCEYGQGYFFSRPLDSSAAEALIMANPRW